MVNLYIYSKLSYQDVWRDAPQTRDAPAGPSLEYPFCSRMDFWFFFYLLFYMSIYILYVYILAEVYNV